MSSKPRHRVFVVYDLERKREDITRRLSLEEDMVVVGTTKSMDEALWKIKLTQPDIVVFHLAFEEQLGLDILRMVVNKAGELPVLVLSLYDDVYTLAKALQFGVRGFVSRQAGEAEIPRAIRRILDGDFYVNINLQQGLLERVRASLMSLKGAIRADTSH
ncbi:MAG TPA: response regulator [Spirochaetia bacterium]|nr:response regulator [Spirochaetia bacterium]